MRKPGYVLDSYALLSYFQKERGSERIVDLLRQAERGEVVLFVSEINVGELFYIIGRRRGKSAAEQILSILEDLPIQRLEATYKRVIQAAGLKRELAISYADCFVLAAAEEWDAKVITGDPEFEKARDRVEVVWIGCYADGREPGHSGHGKGR